MEILVIRPHLSVRIRANTSELQMLFITLWIELALSSKAAGVQQCSLQDLAQTIGAGHVRMRNEVEDYATLMGLGKRVARSVDGKYTLILEEKFDFLTPDYSCVASMTVTQSGRRAWQAKLDWTPTQMAVSRKGEAAFIGTRISTGNGVVFFDKKGRPVKIWRIDAPNRNDRVKDPQRTYDEVFWCKSFGCDSDGRSEILWIESVGGDVARYTFSNGRRR